MLNKETTPRLYKFARKLWVLLLSLWYVITETLKNKLLIHASSCTYYFLVSLVPILIFTGWGIVSAAQRPEIMMIIESISLYTEIMDFVARMGITIPQVRFGLSIVGIFSILYVLWSASALMRGISTAFKDIFNSENKRRNMLITFAAYVFIPLFLISSIIFVTMANVLAGAAKWLISDVFNLLSPEEIIAAFVPLLTYIFIWMAALLAFLLLAPRKPSVKAAMVGSFAFAVYFFLLQHIVMSMMANLIKSYAIYGALGTLLLILLWAYLVFFGLFAIAQYTAIVSNFRHYCRFDAYFTLLKPTHTHSIVERIAVMQLPFVQDDFLVSMAEGETRSERIALIRVMVGEVLIDGVLLRAGEYKMLQAATVQLEAVAASRLLLLDEKELAVLIKTYPNVWEEIGG
ncbi:MAG: YihY/virulence factor BrkB family protein [Deferribacteraceae bacterium]|jgi:YihY family inner membrane protein|nr:YihY/virulence factor BrkB family protein [Deferribacteraceae bacterium]